MEGSPTKPGLAAQLLAALPQTQCQRCGFVDCSAYATAMAAGDAGINQCPPGGAQGVARLAALTGQAPVPLNLAHGAEGPRSVVFIDEAWCIGCTLCIKACPTDAIIGSNKAMHTVQEAHCTGCALCLPVCPVDCIVVENASGEASGWAAWSPTLADTARDRYAQRSARLAREEQERLERQARLVQTKLADLAGHSRVSDPAVLERKRGIIEAALARARAKSSKPAP